MSPEKGSGLRKAVLEYEGGETSRPKGVLKKKEKATLGGKGEENRGKVGVKGLISDRKRVKLL